MWCLGGSRSHQRMEGLPRARHSALWWMYTLPLYLLDRRSPLKASQAANDMQSCPCARHRASHLDLLDAGALRGLQDKDALDEVLARLGHRDGFGEPSRTAAQLRHTALDLTEPACTAAHCSQLQSLLAQACSSGKAAFSSAVQCTPQLHEGTTGKTAQDRRGQPAGRQPHNKHTAWACRNTTICRRFPEMESFLCSDG